MVIVYGEMGPSVLTKGVQGVQYSGFRSARGRRSRYSGFSSVRARVNVPFMENWKKKSVSIACLALDRLSLIQIVMERDLLVYRAHKLCFTLVQRKVNTM